ncbi:hypothetical protein [Micromonospora sp. CPCC 206061]
MGVEADVFAVENESASREPGGQGGQFGVGIDDVIICRAAVVAIAK